MTDPSPKNRDPAIEKAITALNDWLHTYAPEECGAALVASSLKRIMEHGGTLAYIAAITADLRAYPPANPRPGFDPDPPTRDYVNLLKGEIEQLRGENAALHKVLAEDGLTAPAAQTQMKGSASDDGIEAACRSFFEHWQFVENKDELREAFRQAIAAYNAAASSFGEPVAEIVEAATPAAQLIYGRDVKFYEGLRDLPIGTKLYAAATEADHG